MKRLKDYHIFPLFMLLLMLLLLCACGKNGGNETPAEPGDEPAAAAETVPPEPTVQPLAIPELSLEESRQMATFLSGNRALISGYQLYSFSFDEKYHPVLGSFHLQAGTPTSFQLLAEDCVPEYLCLHGSVLYYLNAARNDALERIGTDGSNRETLMEGPVSYLQLVGDQLRYRRADGCYCACELDGSGERVLIDGDVYYPYTMEDLVLYQDNLDGERLHLRRISDGKELVLTEGEAYAPLVFNGCLYYSSDSVYRLDPELGNEPQRLDLAEMTGTAELLPDSHGLQIRALRETEEGLLQWTAGESGVRREEERSYRLCEFLGDYRVEVLYQPDGRILSFLLVAPDGTETRYLGAVVPGEITTFEYEP